MVDQYRQCMQELYDILENGSRGCSELAQLVKDFVRAASWQELLQPVLPLLPEEAVLQCCTHAMPGNAPGENASILWIPLQPKMHSCKKNYCWHVLLVGFP